MKTPAFPPVSSGSTTWFQTAARMDVPAGIRPARSGPVITEKTFADLRQAAGAAREAAAGQPVSFDTVRLTAFVHSLERKLKAAGLRQPA